MTAPSSTSFLRPDIGQSFEEFDLVAERMGYVGAQVLRPFDTQLQTANFSKIPVEELLKDTKTERAPGSGYNRDKYTFEQDSYACVENGAEEPVDDRERQMYAYSFDIERISAERAMNRVLRDLEKKVAAAVFNTSTWTGASLTTAVGTRWSTAASCTPVADVLGALNSVRASSGMLPNAVIMSWNVWRLLQSASSIIQQLIYSGTEDPKMVTTQQLAALFHVEQVIVAGGVKNTAKEGKAASISDIWSDDFVMVAKLSTSTDLREACIGRLFHFTADGSSSGGTVEQYRDESVRSDIMRVRMDYHAKIIHPQCGHLLSNITA